MEKEMMGSEYQSRRDSIIRLLGDIALSYTIIGSSVGAIILETATYAYDYGYLDGFAKFSPLSLKRGGVQG